MNAPTRPPLIGHEQRWAALVRAFVKGVVPQTLLISGPPQVGKWTLALRYAQLLLCPGVESDEGGLPAPCGHCRVCHQVAIGTFQDFIVVRPISAASKEERDWIAAPEMLEGSVITVDMARKFGNEALRKPVVGARKVMLINQADRMNVEAQNALLKTFEEPVRGLTIALLADNPSQLLPTVRSRCWHLPLGLAPDEAIARWLRDGFPGMAPQIIEEAVRVAVGRPGAASRELQRLQHLPSSNPVDSEPDGDEPQAAQPRFVQAARIVERIVRARPVGALGLTEEALRMARLWWAEDQSAATARDQKKDSKKSDAKELRSAIARFLDELANAYRARWMESVGPDSTPPNGAAAGLAEAHVWAAGLDQIRKTRHYILRNANSNLALDVMFGRLIAQHQASQ